LNRSGGEAAADFGVTGGTDVTGFGLVGHALEMARASGVCLAVDSERVPALPDALNYAAMGLVPAGTWANQKHCADSVRIEPGVKPEMISLLADAQTSGGLLLAVPVDRVDAFLARLHQGDAPAATVIGEVRSQPAGVLAVR
jgi:selenide,water dikinase